MMEGVVQRGTGRIVALARPAARRQDRHHQRFQRHLVRRLLARPRAAGVYVGFDQPKSLGKHETGATVAAPAFSDFMAEALKDKPAIPFRIPPGIALVRVNATTGQLARAGDRNVIYEAFKPGTEPTRSQRRRRCGQRPTAAVPRDAGDIIPATAATMTSGNPTTSGCRRPLPRPAPAAYIEPAFDHLDLTRVAACAPRSRRWPARSGARWRCCGGIFDWDNATRRLAELNALVEDPRCSGTIPRARSSSCASAPGSTRASTAISRIERELR